MTQKRYCSKCNQINLLSAQFCSNCGMKFKTQNPISQNNTKRIRTLSTKKSRKKKELKPKVSDYLWLIFIVGLILVVVIIMNSKPTNSISNSPSAKPTIQDLALQEKVFEVASKFTCSCGSCNDEDLETCTCNTAARERNFILQELKSGKTISQAVLAVNEKYGHLKPEFVNKIEIVGANIDLSKPRQNEIFPNLSTSSSDSNTKIASSDDRKEIFSHFECPCGQCDMPELSECNCTHPKGATEVKLYVDSQIENEKYTVNELIDIVEREYGHKIR